MTTIYKTTIACLAFTCGVWAQEVPAFGPVKLPSTEALYQQLLRSNVEGIGKFYMGRQISHVMGHQGATWLERPEREREENTTELIRCLKL